VSISILLSVYVSVDVEANLIVLEWMLRYIYICPLFFFPRFLKNNMYSMLCVQCKNKHPSTKNSAKTSKSQDHESGVAHAIFRLSLPFLGKGKWFSILYMSGLIEQNICCKRNQSNTCNMYIVDLHYFRYPADCAREEYGKIPSAPNTLPNYTITKENE